MKMQTILGALIGALLGAAGGATVGYLVAEKRFMQKLDEEVKRLSVPAPVEQPAEVAQTPVDPKVEEMANQYNTVSTENPIQNIPEEKDKVNYTSFSSNPDEKKTDISTKKPVTTSKRDPNTPYRISEDEYSNTCPEYEKYENLLYYIVSHEMIDDDTGEPVDIDEYIGMENLLDLPSDGVVCVRNEPWGRDYKITFVDGAYHYDSF